MSRPRTRFEGPLPQRRARRGAAAGGAERHQDVLRADVDRRARFADGFQNQFGPSARDNPEPKKSGADLVQAEHATAETNSSATADAHNKASLQLKPWPRGARR